MSQLETNSRVTLAHKDTKRVVKWLGFGRSRDDHGPEIALVIATEDGETQNLTLPTEAAHIVACEILQQIRTSEEHHRANFGNWHDEFGWQTTEDSANYEEKFGKRKSET